MNSTDIAQIAELLEKHTSNIKEFVKAEIATNNLQIAEMIEASETRISIKIENEVTKEIHSLFDGYKTVREAQWELEHKVNTLELQIDDIRNRLASAGIAV